MERHNAIIPMQPMQEEAAAPVLTRPPIGKDEIGEAVETLRKYKAGKAKLEQRIVEDDKWWRMRHFELLDREDFGTTYPSAWLFNSIMGKHAAMMENYPTANVLPREQADEAVAKILTEILPYVLEVNDYKETYSMYQWRRMQSGTGAVGVYWDNKKHNGLGDIAIVPVNVLNIFWEPGVRDIQLSKNLFNVELVDNDILRAQYPELDTGRYGDMLSLKEYAYEDHVDTQDKSLVVDWYYKRRTGGVEELHLCKFVGETLLYSSENEGHPWYDDGKYPFVLDVLFPMEGSPAGFGFIDIGKPAQEQIDVANQAFMRNVLANARPRYFVRENGAVNEAEFADFTRDFVHVQGDMSDMSIRPIDAQPLPSTFLNVLENKIGELKETTANQDVQTGATGGITAASAIQAMQESAGMPMKDATRATYRAFEETVRMVIDRMRQFYDAPRVYRIIGDNGVARYQTMDNSMLRPIPLGPDINGIDQGWRVPEFDLEVIAQSETEYTKARNNEDIINLYNMGFFNPQNADISLMVLDLLDIPRKDKLMDKIRQFATAQQKMQMYGQMAVALAGKHEPQLAQGLMQQLQMDMMAAQAQPGMQQRGAQPAQQSAAGVQPKKEEQTRARAAAATKPS